MTERDSRAGILFIIAATLVFAAQDGITRHLSSAYSPPLVVMVRFWFFAAFAAALATQSPGGLSRAIRTRHTGIQIARGLILITQISLMSLAFVKLGLIETHAIATSNPLIVSALSGPILGERVGWRRWLAVGVGFLGELVILQPGFGVFSPWAVLPAAGAVLFAVYTILTRLVSARDAASTSFLYTGLVGAVGMTAVGGFFWQPMTPADWGWMALLCLFSAGGHWCLIQAYARAEASVVQPFSYLQLVWVSGLGVLLFHETLKPNVLVGMVIVVGAGLFTLWRQTIRAQQTRRQSGRG